MAGYMTTIRIYNDPNDKRTFVRQMVQDFQEHEDISDFKASLFHWTKKWICIKFAQCKYDGKLCLLQSKPVANAVNAIFATIFAQL